MPGSHFFKPTDKKSEEKKKEYYTLGEYVAGSILVGGRLTSTIGGITPERLFNSFSKDNLIPVFSTFDKAQNDSGRAVYHSIKPIFKIEIDEDKITDKKIEKKDVKIISVYHPFNNEKEIDAETQLATRVMKQP